MKHLCECGCGLEVRLARCTDATKGWIKGQPLRFARKGHSSRPSKPMYIEEDRGHKTPCWIWQWGKHQKGYGVFWDKNQQRLRGAHRIFYENKFGPVQSNLQLDHLCRIPSCVNPDHLEPVTHAENLRRGNSSKITKEIADEIRRLRLKGARTIALAGQFGICQREIYHIINNQLWL